MSRPAIKVALAGGALLAAVGLAPVSGLAARAHAGHPAGVHASTRASVKAHLAFLKRLKAALSGKGVQVVGMRAQTRGRAQGYLVQYLKGHTLHQLFINSRTGQVAHLSARPMSPRRAPAAVSVSTFITALENVMTQLTGAPVVASVSDGGAVLTFTLTLSGQTVTVTVSTVTGQTTTSSGSTGTSGSGSSSSGSSSSSSGTTPPGSIQNPSSTFSAPPISLTAAADTALNQVENMGASLSGSYVIGVKLHADGELQVGDQVQASDQGDQGDQGNGSNGTSDQGNSDQGNQGNLPNQALVYRVDLYTPLGNATVDVNAQTGSVSQVQVPSDQGDQGNLGPTPPAVTVDQAVTTALGQDSGGFAVRAQLDQGDNGNLVWDILLMNPDGSVTEVQVDAQSGAVISTQGGDNGQGQDGQGSQGNSGNSGGDN
jgi:uncharacterized membrane protein YkoI